MRAESWPEVKIKTASSEGGTKSACIAEDGKLFILAKATLSIRIRSYSEYPVRAGRPWPDLVFYYNYY
jgi:hypothetical protein